MRIKTIGELCTPRTSVFDQSRRDVVLNLSDLLSGEISEDKAESFFVENYPTDGLKSLVGRTFDRVTGVRDQASTFLLAQTMGGGKTHSMIALGLLGKYPKIRSRLWPYHQLASDDIRVIGFDGRETDYQFGIWGALAEQLGKRDLFENLYSPLQAPGVTSWIRLLQGPPTIILLDELPPYFSAAMSKSVGDSNLASVTTTALSNLMVAANKEELSNVAIVISDLSASAYKTEGVGVMAALNDLEKETNRSALVIEPVGTQGDEVFEILKTRLFEKLPGEDAIAAIAAAYQQEVTKARAMELTNATPEVHAGEIRESYPFHFSLRDLYGRFKENPNFQQTRGLLRMMRSVVANIWQSKASDRLFLVHAYDIDLNDKEIFSEFDRINSTLGEAVRADIANSGASYAEQIDAELGTTDATDAAKLLYVASLSTAQKAIVGLRDMEIVAWMCAPGRRLERLMKDVLEVLPNRAWYLHLSVDGRYYFKNIQNLAARLFGMVRDTPQDNRAQELRQYLKKLFEPKVKDLYQDLYVLSPIDEIQVSIEKVALIVTTPYPDGRSDAPLHPDWTKFFTEHTLQNRMLFLTGDRDLMDEVYKNAAYVRAIRVILEEQAQEGVSPNDAQAQEARRSLDKYQLSLRSVVQQTFSTLVYPSKGKLRVEHISFNFDDNRFDPERQIRQTLKENQKFSEEAVNDTWIKKVEDRLFDGQNPVVWTEIKRRAAAKNEWQFHHPRLLDDIRNQAERMGKWRPEGSMVRRGPFQKEQTSVSVTLKSQDDDSGEAILTITPVGGSVVYYEVGERTPNESSAKVNSFHDFRTKELVLTFLCIDEGPDPHPTGDSLTWKNTIRVKGRFYQQGDSQMFTAMATPEAPMRYTTDGSDPRTHGTSYTGDFPIPPGTHVVQCVAEHTGAQSDVASFRVSEAKTGLDPTKPATWKCQKRFRNLQPTEGYQVLERAREYEAALSDVTINVISPDTDETIYYTLPQNQSRTGDELVQLAEDLTALIPRGQMTITVGSVRFDTGQQLLDWQQHDKLSIDPETEVHQ